jgi:hypothetical protein
MIQQAIGPPARVLTSTRKTDIQIAYLKMGFRPNLTDLSPADYFMVFCMYRTVYRKRHASDLQGAER